MLFIQQLNAINESGSNESVEELTQQYFNNHLLNISSIYVSLQWTATKVDIILLCQTSKVHPTRKTREQKTRVFLQKVEHHSPYTEPKLEFWAKTRVFRLQKSTTWQTRNVRLSTFATKKSRTFIIDFFGNPKSKPAWRHPKKAGLSKLENFLKNSSFPCRVEVFQSRKKKSDLKSRVFTNSTFFPCRVGLSKWRSQGRGGKSGNLNKNTDFNSFLMDTYYKIFTILPELESKNLLFFRFFDWILRFYLYRQQ